MINYPTRRTARTIPLDEMTIRELKQQAAKFTNTTRPIRNYSQMDSATLYAALLDRWADAPIEVKATNP